SLISELVEAGIRVALLSNIGKEHSQYFRKLMATAVDSKGISRAIQFFSCEVGARKPSLLYYQTFLYMHPDFKENCLYIDDLQENLDAAKKLGFKTVKFDLKDFLVKDG